MPLWNRLTAFIGGGAVARAGSVALDPAFEPQRQQAWAKSQARLWALDSMAQLVAQGLVAYGDIEPLAAKIGFNPNRLQGAIQLALKAPPYAEVLELWRRGKFGTVDPSNPPAEVTHALAKAQIEPQYWPAIAELFYERLSPQDVAVMVQRGILPNPDWLPVGPPTEVGKVKPMPQANIDPVAEAQAHGFDAERAAALAKIIGLPASPDLAARMTFRGIIDRVDFDRAIAEGNTRNEWADVLFDGFREILTAHDYAELQLRGFLTEEERLANTAKHGMSVEDSNLLYDVLGRAPSLHNVLIGLRRGGKYPGSYANVPEPYKSAIQRSNIREEWAEVVYATRVVYPSAFVIRALLKDGVLHPDDGYNLLIEMGWREDLARKVADHYGQPTTAAAKKLTAAEIKAVWRTGRYNDTEAERRLELLGLTATDAADLVAAWKFKPPVIPEAT